MYNKKIFSLVLVAVMVFSSIGVFADDIKWNEAPEIRESNGNKVEVYGELKIPDGNKGNTKYRLFIDGKNVIPKKDGTFSKFIPKSKINSDIEINLYEGKKLIGTETIRFTDDIEQGLVKGNGFSVKNTEDIKGYSTEWTLSNGTFRDAEVVVKLYNGKTLLQKNTLLPNHKLRGDTITSPFDVFGNFDYKADGYWKNVIVSQGVATRTTIEVKFPNGEIATAEQTKLVGDTSIFTRGNVIAQDFGVMNFSKVKGYTVGFKLIDAKASDVESIKISLYKNKSLLGTVESDKVLKNYPDLDTLSAPFDVLGSFGYKADENWKYSGWKGRTSSIPDKAVITVTFKNGVVKDAINETLTGDASIFR